MENVLRANECGFRVAFVMIPVYVEDGMFVVNDVLIPQAWGAESAPHDNGSGDSVADLRTAVAHDCVAGVEVTSRHDVVAHDR